MKLKIGIVYFTNTDITGQLVRGAAQAIENTGANVFLHAIKGSEIVEGRFTNMTVFKQLQATDAIIFAAPTYMGGPAAQFKAFADATSPIYSTQCWRGKFASGITSGSSLNGDQTCTLQYFSTLASQHGMCWLGVSAEPNKDEKLQINRLGCQLGVVAQSTTDSVHKVDLQTTKSLGERIVNQLLKLKAN